MNVAFDPDIGAGEAARSVRVSGSQIAEHPKQRLEFCASRLVVGGPRVGGFETFVAELCD